MTTRKKKMTDGVRARETERRGTYGRVEIGRLRLEALPTVMVNHLAPFR